MFVFFQKRLQNAHTRPTANPLNTGRSQSRMSLPPIIVARRVCQMKYIFFFLQ